MDTPTTPPPPRPLPPPNPKTQALHRRDMLWQITVPFVVALLILLLLVGLVVWAGAAGNPEVSRWADVSLVWILSPMIILSLLVMTLLAAIVYGLVKLIGVLPRYTRLVQDFMILVRLRVREYADRAVEPVLKAKSAQAASQKLADELRLTRKKDHIRRLS